MTIQVPFSLITLPAVMIIKRDPLFTIRKLDMSIQIFISCKNGTTSFTPHRLYCYSKVDNTWILPSVNSFLMSLPISLKSKVFPAYITLKVSFV